MSENVTHSPTHSLTHREDCCGYCTREPNCAGAAYHHNNMCVLRAAPLETKSDGKTTVCKVKRHAENPFVGEGERAPTGEFKFEL